MDLTERMQIEWQLTSLTNRFVYYMDSGNFDAMVELFTPDAQFDRAGTFIVATPRSVRSCVSVRKSQPVIY
jgi:hypothetical protein